jgi:hypothetical protein
MVGSQELFFEFGPICLKALKVAHYGHHPRKTQVGPTAIDAGPPWSPSPQDSGSTYGDRRRSPMVTTPARLR